jgi:hypothetical protein
MSGTLVKICGLCDAGAARAAAGAGADLLGFHFCSSLRRVTPEEALAMVDALDRRPGLVGVFIDQPEAEVEQIADFVGLDWVQLHGSEPPGFRASRPVVKALKVRDAGPAGRDGARLGLGGGPRAARRAAGDLRGRPASGQRGRGRQDVPAPRGRRVERRRVGRPCKGSRPRPSIRASCTRGRW